jgi:hypothetical protein
VRCCPAAAFHATEVEIDISLIYNSTAKPKDMLKYLRRAPKVAPNADDMP